MPAPVPRLTGPQLSRGCRGPECTAVMCVTGDLWAVGRVGWGQVKSRIWKPCYCPEAALRLLLPRDHKLAGELARLRGGLRIPAWPVAPPPPSRPAPPPPRASPAGNHLSSPSPRWSYRIAREQRERRGERGGERGEKREGHLASYFSTPREAAVQPLGIRIRRRPGTARKMWLVAQPSGNSCWGRTPTRTSWLPPHTFTWLPRTVQGVSSGTDTQLAWLTDWGELPAWQLRLPHQGFP